MNSPFRLRGSNSLYAIEEPSDGIRANVLLGLAVSILLIGGVGAWATTTTIAGAVIASGSVVVESSAKKVQHQTGGIVGAINVREGDRVTAGDVIVRLDETMMRANLQIIAQQYDRAIASQARLQAERLGLPEMKLPDELAKRAGDPDVRELVAGEKALFESREKADAGLKAQLDIRCEQLGRQIEGLKAQKEATVRSAALVERDYNSLKALYDKKLVPLERVSDLQLELSRLQGESGRLTAAIAETEGKISETKLQSLQVDEEARKEVNKDLRELDAKEVELIERKVVAEDQLARTEIRAPQSGFVQELAVHTVGGVIVPGETIMLIVPEQDRLVVDAMVAPTSIDDVVSGQPVSVRFSAFDVPTTPECKGTVQRVSADLIKDAQRQASYFVARVVLDDQKSCLRGARRLQPGMPAEVHIQTGERYVWTYVMKPLSDQLQRAFRE
ncbi:HlyD family type I secretion periplasmic adaptor subunit [Mesorhizobium sp. M3A.F.Ca.ET.080.04.2.1]|uniref:HlyD family type I secretion periplasmic adaptor subunit n=1 Tax=Mesorhizobium sp. M3A.F.Ca.ET.080.04.2.1 TaxID=2493676 RepID=UPI000F7610C4|nr:HlyD family type I secretion periplasmic adaptor subunit [Mesorhizobium sp. M3A.F.Ca.ET.080.04.2.1]AZO12803.1 HlyD family type I secretion periplasmic adaptor subunit [Mesorhizobium sp. M3A.F.Ca.ET.080.04.2.1]